MDEAARGLDEAGEGEEEADEERDVLDRHRRRPRVPVDQLALEDVRVVGDPRADQRAQRQGHRRQERRRRYVRRHHVKRRLHVAVLRLPELTRS